MEDIIKTEAEETITKEAAVDMQSVEENEHQTPEAVQENASPIEEEKPEEVLSPLEALIRVGLSEREATLVLNDRERCRISPPAPSDSLPRMAHSPRLNISYGELMQMKEIFDGLSDTEINRLYNKVTN